MGQWWVGLYGFHAQGSHNHNDHNNHDERNPEDEQVANKSHTKTGVNKCIFTTAVSIIIQLSTFAVRCRDVASGTDQQAVKGANYQKHNILKTRQEYM